MSQKWGTGTLFPQPWSLDSVPLLLTPSRLSLSVPVGGLVFQSQQLRSFKKYTTHHSP